MRALASPAMKLTLQTYQKATLAYYFCQASIPDTSLLQLLSPGGTAVPESIKVANLAEKCTCGNDTKADPKPPDLCANNKH